MKKLILFAVCFTSVFLGRKTLAGENFTLIHVSELEAIMKTDQVHIYDANDDGTRTSEGMIPSAQALSSSSRYDVAVLDKDKEAKLVFYCANSSCMASHSAAKVATKAGYKNVYVMSDGILGWKKAGKPTQKFNKKA